MLTVSLVLVLKRNFSCTRFLQIPQRSNIASRGLAAIQRLFMGGVTLNEAASDGDIERVKFLLSKGADVTAKTDVGGMTALHLAAENGRRDVVELLLQKMDSASIAATD